MVTVVATQMGFDGVRRRVGAVFQMDETKWPKGKDGKPRQPKWVQIVKNEREGQQVAAEVQSAEDKRMREGALAASGGKAAKAKVESIAEQVGS